MLQHHKSSLDCIVTQLRSRLSRDSFLFKPIQTSPAVSSSTTKNQPNQALSPVPFSISIQHNFPAINHCENIFHVVLISRHRHTTETQTSSKPFCTHSKPIIDLEKGSREARAGPFDFNSFVLVLYGLAGGFFFSKKRTRMDFHTHNDIVMKGQVW
jgi:hypothetical protein